MNSTLYIHGWRGGENSVIFVIEHVSALKVFKYITNTGGHQAPWGTSSGVYIDTTNISKKKKMLSVRLVSN